MTQRVAARALIALVVIAAVAAACIPFGAESPPTSGAGPDAASTAVFGQRLAFGVRNDPKDLDWMTGSGVPWAARYTYLAGGVNTGEGWATWTTEPGFYATDYAKRTIAAGYVPIFSYYQLQQSRPRIGDTERDRANSNLNDRTTMKDYYRDFRLLMRSLAGIGTTVVHVEPDLWGYLEQTHSIVLVHQRQQVSGSTAWYIDLLLGPIVEGRARRSSEGKRVSLEPTSSSRVRSTHAHSAIRPSRGDEYGMP